MIGDGGIDVAANGRQERHQGAKAVALDGNLARTVWHLDHGVQSVLNIFQARVTIVRLIEAKAMLPVSL